MALWRETSPHGALWRGCARVAAWVEAGVLGALGQRPQRVWDQVGAGGSDTDPAAVPLSPDFSPLHCWVYRGAEASWEAAAGRRPLGTQGG